MYNEYERPTNLQNFTQKDLTEVKIFQNVLGGYFFSETSCIWVDLMRSQSYASGGYYVPMCLANIGIFSLHTNFERISMKCGEVSLPPTDESADYILGEIVPRTREQDMTENSNRRQTGTAT